MTPYKLVAYQRVIMSPRRFGHRRKRSIGSKATALKQGNDG
jgi:hypothetical protein